MATLGLPAIGRLLRGEVESTPTALDRRSLIGLLATGAAAYGLAMGSFAMDEPSRLLQSVFSAIKTPILLLFATCLCMPSYFVVNTLLGLRDDFGEAISAIVAGQSAMAVVLASFAPIAVFWNFSTRAYQSTIVFHGVVFALASVAAQIVLRRRYAFLIERNRRHRWTLRFWLAMYWLVTIQSAWSLRPFIGTPGTPVRLFREDAFTNAFEAVGRIVMDTLTHR